MEGPVSVNKKLKELLTTLILLQVRLEKALDEAPEGRIQFREKSEGTRFFCYDPQKPEEYLGKDKEAKIKRLAQKKLDQELLKEVLREKAELERALQRLENTRGSKELKDVAENFPEKLKPYVSLDPVIEQGFVQRWLKRIPGEPRNKKPDTLFFSIKGDHVRSKSEILIADRLYNAGVPYVYERAYQPYLGAELIFPDFTILHPRTYEVWYWEHFGKMDEVKYSTEAKKRLEDYSFKDIYPGKNLIITFETSKSPLNTDYVENLIKMFFL